MNIVIWGFGKNGKKCLALFEKHFKEDKVLCFVDMDSKKQNMSASTPVINIQKLKSMYAENLVNLIVIPGYEPYIYLDIIKQLFILDIDYPDLLLYAEPEYFEDKIYDGICSFSEILDLRKKEIPLIGALEYEISEKCNLNCKRCNHYSNIFDDGIMTDLQEFITDCKLLKNRVYNIKRFKLLGGEPLLNNELHRYVEETRKIFPNTYIAIVTNGLLIPMMSQALIEAIRKTHTFIEISVYPPIKNRLEEIENFLQENKVQYAIFRQGDLFGSYFTEDASSNAIGGMMKCFGQVCHAMKRGRIYKCATVQNIHIFNKKYDLDMPESYLILNKEHELSSAEDIYNYLVQPIPLCRYCTDFVYHPWEQTRGDAKKSDWMVKSK